MRRAGLFALFLLGACGRLGYVPDRDAAVDRDSGDRDSDAGSLDAARPLDGGPEDAARDAARVDAAVDCTTATFGGHDYAICRGPLTWSAAQAVCAARGMHLVRVDSPDEQAFLHGLGGGASRAILWMGASDLALEDTWVWEDGTTFFVDSSSGGMAIDGAFVAWGSAEPNGRDREGCAALESNGVWIDLGCEQLGDAICESP